MALEQWPSPLAMGKHLTGYVKFKRKILSFDKHFTLDYGLCVT
jgi:hypothetical protein